MQAYEKVTPTPSIGRASLNPPPWKRRWRFCFSRFQGRLEVEEAEWLRLGGVDTAAC